MNEIWLQEDQKFRAITENILVPDEHLSNTQYIVLRTPDDFGSIPTEGGCYWIWTDEPVHHCLHKNPIPISFDKGEIIYNGIAKDNVRQRIINHLYGNEHARWSAISMD